jgi:hypothetical protein
MNPTLELKNVGTSGAYAVIRKEDIRAIFKNATCVQVLLTWHVTNPESIGYVMYRTTQTEVDTLYTDLMVEWETYLESV